MAHALSMVNTITELGYLLSDGDCWHGLGQALKDDATFAEWLSASNIGSWSIEKQKALMIINGALHLVPNIRHLTRSDNNYVLGTVSDQFNVHQPNEVAEYMWRLVETMGFQMTTMGVLFDGKKFWCQANIKQSVNIGGVDRVNGKLLIAVPNTGKEATTIHYGTTRVVCNNTLRAAMQRGQTILKLTHLNEFKPEEISKQLGIFNMDEWAETAEKMTQIKLTESKALDFFGRVFKYDVEKDMSETTGSNLLDSIILETQKEQATADGSLLDSLIHTTNAVASTMNKEAQQAERDALLAKHKTIGKVYELFNFAGKGSELPTAKDTLWGAVNAVTEHIDHNNSAKSFDSAFNSTQFGVLATVKDRAWDEAIMMIS